MIREGYVWIHVPSMSDVVLGEPCHRTRGGYIPTSRLVGTRMLMESTCRTKEMKKATMCKGEQVSAHTKDGTKSRTQNEKIMQEIEIEADGVCVYRGR